MKLAKIAAAAMLLATAACHSSMSGKYADRNGIMSVEFKSGKAYLETPGGTVQVDYSVDGDNVILKTPQGNLVLAKHSDGTLDGPTGTLTKTD